MNVYDQLLMEFPGIETTLTSYSSECHATMLLPSLKQALTNYDKERALYCLGEMDNWYQKNLSKIYSNSYVFHKDEHLRVAELIHITYNILDEHYDTDIFTEPTLKGKLGTNVMKVQRHLYDHLIYDSTNERDFAADLDTNRDVAVYVKLPDGFYISTPVGKYNPDWAIAFYEGTVKHIYFVAETKGTLDSMKLNHITPVEQAKIDCARAHFKALNDENVVYDVVRDYQTLLNAVMK